MLRSLGFGPSHRPRARFWLSGVAIWADFEIFEILGGAGDIYNSISMPNYCDGSHIHVGVYTIKDTSALTDVLVSPWPSRASIMPPGGRCLGDF